MAPRPARLARVAICVVWMLLWPLVLPAIISHLLWVKHRRPLANMLYIHPLDDRENAIEWAADEMALIWPRSIAVRWFRRRFGLQALRESQGLLPEQLALLVEWSAVPRFNATGKVASWQLRKHHRVLAIERISWGWVIRGPMGYDVPMSSPVADKWQAMRHADLVSALARCALLEGRTADWRLHLKVRL